MNGSPQLPQYTFDPVTKRFTLITPAQQSQQTQEQQGRSGLGGLYDATAGGGGMAPGVSGNPAAGSSGFMGGLGQAAMGYGQAFGGFAPGGFAAGIIGSALADQAIAQNAQTDAAIAAANATGTPVGVTMGAFGPVATTDSDAVAGLAAANAAMAAQQSEAASQASVANTASSVASSIGQATAEGVGDAADADAGAVGGIGDGGVGGIGDGGMGGDGGFGDGGGDSGAASGGGGEGEREGGMIRQRNYKAGGLASAAQHVQSKGRGDDSVLVHMTPKEVRSLQAIAMQHGGSLTVNPETGLVEANFLKSILPMVAGAALAATGIGAPMAAMLVGGGTTLMTGSLEKGLMAGLGAFGGAGLGTALGAAGATAPTVTGTAPGLASAGSQAALTGAPGIGGIPAQNALMGNLASGQSFYGANLAPGAISPAQVAAGQTTASFGAPGFGQNISQMGAGVKALGTEAGRAAFMQSVGGPMGLATKVGGPLAAGLFSAEEKKEKGIKPQAYIRPYSFDYQKASDLDPSFRYRTGERGESTAEQRYFTPTFTPLGTFKAGTEPGGSFYGTPTQEQLALYSRPKDQNILGLAAGGIAGLGKGGLRDGAFIVPADVVSHLGNGSNDAGQKILRGLGARPIKGKGDGMSDSIPTTIEGRQPARVADGEAYIPPEVVKKIGAKRLYSMMAKIRQARTGTKKQAPEVNAEAFLPA